MRCGENRIKYCVLLSEDVLFEACLSEDLIPTIVPEYGTCGECPDEPSMNPTSATAAPSVPPTGYFDGCVVDPPTCTITGGPENEDRVTFCLVLENGLQVDLCVLVEDVKDLLDRGKFRQ